MNTKATSRRARLANILIVGGVLTAVALTGWVHEQRAANHPTGWHSDRRHPHISPAPNPRGDAGTEPAVMTLRHTSGPSAPQEIEIKLWMKDLHRVQAEWHAASAIDENDNELGEYALLGELSGVHTERCTPRAYITELAEELHSIDDSTSVVHGFVVQLFLPDVEGNAVVEASSGGVGGTRPDPDSSELAWCCYAWPEQRPRTGKSVYFIDQSGVLLRSDNEMHQYSGRFRRPLPTAAYSQQSSGRLGTAIANHAIGVDGQRWNVIE